MNRHIVAGMVGLALAGCAQTRSAMPNRGTGLGPVGLTSFPSIHDTINRENPAVDPAAVRAAAGLPATQPGSSRIVYTPGQAPAVVSANPANETTAASDPAASARSSPIKLEVLDRSQPQPENPSPGLGDSAQASAASPSPSPSPNPGPAEREESLVAPAPVPGAETDATPAGGPPPVGADPATPAADPQAPGSAGASPAPETPAPASLPPAEESPAGQPVPPAVPAAPPDPSVGAEPDSVPPIALPSPSREEPPASSAGESAPAAPATPPAAAPNESAPAGPEPMPAAPPAEAPPAVEPPVVPPAAEAPPAVEPKPVVPPAAEAPPAVEAPPAGPPAVEAPPAIEPPPAGPPAAEAPPAVEAPPAGPPAEAPPAVEPLPGVPPGAPPAVPPAESTPPALPPLEGGSAVPPAMPPPDPSVGAQPDAVPDVPVPRSAEGPAETQAPPIPPALPPVEPVPAAPPASMPAENVSNLKRDLEIKAAGTDATMVRSEVRARNLQPAGSAAATVGDEVITMSEWRAAVRDQLKNVPAEQRPTEADIDMLAAATLRELIERSVLVQEAKRELKDPQKVKFFLDNADKVWHEEELPPLLRKYMAANEFQLKEKLAEQGLSLDQIRENYRRQFLSHQYLRSKLNSQLSVSLPEMRDYYNEHLHDFDRPAQTAWREVVIETDKCASRAEARAKIDAVLARLRRGEDFAALAKAISDGPNKALGGHWETSPGSYGVESVNAAIESLPMNQVSQVIEGPSSYHIVRVEGRRAAGPATFPEVQERVKKAIYEQKTHQAMNKFIGKLRNQTLITSVFDRTANEAAAAAAPGR